MKDIWVTSRNNVYKDAHKYGATHVISLVDYGKQVSVPSHIKKENWLMMNFKDELDKYVPGGPTRHHVETALKFARDLPEDAILLVHCEAGISRSTATATAILTQKLGADRYHEAAKIIKTKRPQACFNPVIAEYADEYLGIGGHFLEQATQMWNANGKW